MTSAQRVTAEAYLDVLVEQYGAVQLSLEHGDCVGADAELDALAADRGIARVCRPCHAPEDLRANTKAVRAAPPQKPMVRNRAIVGDSDLMIAIPPNDKPIKSGSGTWATIGFAREAAVTLHIIWPDGSSTHEPAVKRHKWTGIPC